MSEEGEKRKVALLRFKVLAGLLVVLSIILLVCAGLGVRYYDDDDYEPPYYIAGFIVGPLALLSSLLSLSVLVGAMGKSFDDDKMKRLAPQISCQYTVSMGIIPACFIGSIFAGIWGLDVDDSNSNSEKNKTLAAIILAGCILTFCVNIVSMCTVCTYGKHFGVHINRRGRRTIIIADSSSAGTRPSGGANDVVVHNNMNVFTTGTNREHVNQLQQQNLLLQQQLALQQQMLMQQQQQQQEVSGGVYPPPPAYTDPAYPPSTSFPEASAPPPPYSKVA